MFYPSILVVRVVVSHGCGLLNGRACGFPLLHFRAHWALFTLFHGRHAFHFPHAHFAHAVFTAFALTIFAALAFLTTRHFHIHARHGAALRVGTGSDKNKHDSGQ
jgi:hypothetical protein